MRLQGRDSIIIELGTKFVDPGAIAFDNEDFDISSKVVRIGEVSTDSVAQYPMMYTVADQAGNTRTIRRDFFVMRPPSYLVYQGYWAGQSRLNWKIVPQNQTGPIS